MIKRTLSLILCIACLMICTGCHAAMEDSQQTNRSEEKPDKLVVYLSGIPSDFAYSDDPEDERNMTLYPSQYMVGMRCNSGEFDCPNGNIFHQAVEDYTKETGIDIEVHYIQEYSGPSDILQELYDKGKALPDLLVMGKHSQYDYYRLAKQNFLLDFSEYAAADEDLQDADQYYQPVIEGGKINRKQVAMPILFNLNGLITSQSYLSSLGMPAPTVESSYMDMMHLLEESCIEAEKSKTKEAILENSGEMVSGSYLMSILLAAAYPSYFDDTAAKLTIKPETISSILELMTYYYRQEFAAIPGWEENSYIDNLSNLKMKRRNCGGGNSEDYKEVGVFLSGGRAGGVNLHNSLLGDAAYFHSVYKQNGDEMVLCGIPTEEASGRYSANISAVAFGFQSTKYPETVYQLARYLMDYEYPPFYGFSINKELTEQQLEDVQKTTLTIYPNMWGGITGGYVKMEEVEYMIEELEPLDVDSVEIIQNMLDHIVGAGLSYDTLEYRMMNSMLRAVSDHEMTIEEATDWIMEHMAEHLQRQSELEPFYDQEYERALSGW